MDGNMDVYDSITSSNESEVTPEEINKIDTSKTEGSVIVENDINFVTTQHSDELSHKYVEVNANVTNTEDQNVSLEGNEESVLINEVETVPMENINISVVDGENPEIVTSVGHEPIDTCINNLDSSSNTTTADNNVNQDISSLQSIVENNITTHLDFEELPSLADKNEESTHDEMGPNLEHSQSIKGKEETSIENEVIKSNNYSGLEEKTEIKLDESLQDDPQITEQILEPENPTEDNSKCSNPRSNIEGNDEKIELNNAGPEKAKDQENLITDEHIELITNENKTEKEVINHDQLIHNTVSQDSQISEIDKNVSEKIETIEEQVESIHDPKLQNQSATQEFADQEFADITQTTEESKETVQNIPSEDSIEASTVTDHIDTVTINNGDQIITENVADSDNIEKQMSSIVQDENEKTEKTMSIVEAIQRDFDETDSEEIDKPDSVEESQPLEVTDHVMVGVNISDELQRGTVTVTDNTGQVYYVQSVEDLIVVENDDLSATLDQPETLEVTVLSEDSVQQQSDSPKIKERPPIPSHILGRNIDNPVIDTFRNGKVPPKPRLGVKIPYKNLTSQIVSKDELAKEILDRQKLKYKQSGQTTREILFAKKLTQRLAKKIVPTATGKPATVTVEKNEPQAINNSDLLAILEGDGDDTKSACTSASNVGSSLEDKKKDQNSQVRRERSASKAVMSKTAEREIALKQLREVSTGFSSKRRWSGAKLPTRKGKSEPEIQITVVEAETPVEASTAMPMTQEEKKDPEKVMSSKNDNIEEIVTKSSESSIVKQTTSSLLENENSKTIEIKASTSKIKSVDVKQLETKANKVENLADEEVKSKAVDSEIKKHELKQPISEEPVELKKDVSLKNKPSNISEPSPHEVPKLQPMDKATTAPVVTSVKSATATVKAKTDVTNDNISPKVDDNPVITDVTTQPVVTMVTESNKISGKVDILTDVKPELIERKHISNPPVKTYTRKRKSTEDSSILSNVPDKKPVIMQKDINIPPNTYITKSSRVIKRKVIWDPDEPSTARSLARFSKADLAKSEKPLKPEVSSSKADKKPVVKSVVKTETIKSAPKSPDNQKIKKRLSEIDKLLMDEGAVNMLYAFKNVDDAIKKKKTTVISLDKAQRELLNKTNELKKDLKTNSDKISPKSLRRKDSPIPSPSKKIVPALVSRKKSKDSNRSSVHSPPASPGMIYLNHAEASRIIRRHSSSSYSSMEGDFDIDKKIETEDHTMTPTDTEKISKKRIASLSAEGNKIKKTKRNTDKENITIDIEKSKTIEEMPKNIGKLVGDEARESKYNKYKTFSVKEMDHLVQIILLPSFNNEAYLTPEILNELCNILKELQNDANCTVVLISSSASSFCHGINYKTLLSDKEQSRRTFARKLAQYVTNFLRILATFTKILVAGVHGDTVGLGVTILPLFDMVIASDTATFSIPNARLGCAAEGGSLLSLPHLLHNVLVSELLYASRKLIAAEALRLGMVTRVLWPDKFHQELVSIVRGISHHSPQFMELTKQQLRQRMVSQIESILDKEVDTLVQHWISSECQKNFGVYG